MTFASVLRRRIAFAAVLESALLKSLLLELNVGLGQAGLDLGEVNQRQAQSLSSCVAIGVTPDLILPGSSGHGFSHSSELQRLPG